MNKFNKKSLELIKHQTQQKGHDQQDGAGGQTPCAIAVPLAATPVGSVAVVPEATRHLRFRAATIGLLTESLVGA